MKVEFTEEQRSGVLLAIARLSVERPGWEPAFLRPIAALLDGEAMFDAFRANTTDGAAHFVDAGIEEQIPFCGDVDDGVTCTLPAGHPGEHEALCGAYERRWPSKGEQTRVKGVSGP